jgi:ABC-type multidrug transport system fused ATPase/permease subunit
MRVLPVHFNAARRLRRWMVEKNDKRDDDRHEPNPDVVSMLRVVAPYIHQHRRHFIAALTLKSLGELVFLIIPYKIKVILDAAFSTTGGEEAGAGGVVEAGGAVVDEATRGCQILLVVYAARAVLSHGGGYLQRVAGERWGRTS